jgi:hypothetical protein
MARQPRGLDDLQKALQQITSRNYNESVNGEYIIGDVEVHGMSHVILTFDNIPIKNARAIIQVLHYKMIRFTFGAGRMLPTVSFTAELDNCRIVPNAKSVIFQGREDTLTVNFK